MYESSWIGRQNLELATLEIHLTALHIWWYLGI